MSQTHHYFSKPSQPFVPSITTHLSFIYQIVEDSLEFLGIDDAIFQKSKNGNYCGISFAVDLEDSDAVLQYFKSRDVGSRFGSSIGWDMKIIIQIIVSQYIL